MADLYGAQGTQDAFLGTKSDAGAETARITGILNDAGVDQGMLSQVQQFIQSGLEEGESFKNTNAARLRQQLGEQAAKENDNTPPSPSKPTLG